MRIEDAIEQLDAMSAVAERSATFSGLRASPVAATGLVGALTACVQHVFIRHSAGANESAFAGQFISLWVASASICLAIVLGDMWIRYLREPTRRTRRLTLQVLGRLAPSFLAGSGITLVIMRHSTELAWTLPAWWATLLGLGICSALSLLPRCLRPVGAWYIGAGLLVLMLAKDAWALHPLSMAVPFVGGQLFTAWLITRDPEVGYR